MTLLALKGHSVRGQSCYFTPIGQNEIDFLFVQIFGDFLQNFQNPQKDGAVFPWSQRHDLPAPLGQPCGYGEWVDFCGQNLAEA